MMIYSNTLSSNSSPIYLLSVFRCFFFLTLLDVVTTVGPVPDPVPLLDVSADDGMIISGGQLLTTSYWLRKDSYILATGLLLLIKYYFMSSPSVMV